MPQVSNEFWGFLGAVFFFGSAIIGWLSARKTDKVAAKVEPLASKVSEVETKAEANKVTLDNNTQTLELLQQQNTNQAESIKITGELMDRMRSGDAGHAAERQSWQTTVDNALTRLDRLADAILGNNTAILSTKDEIAKFPAALESAVNRVNTHMDEKLAPTTEEIMKRFDTVDQKIDGLFTLITERLGPSPVGSPSTDQPPIPADTKSESIEVKEPQS